LIILYRTLEKSLDYSYVKPLVSLADQTRLIGTIVPFVFITFLLDTVSYHAYPKYARLPLSR